jgi:hypothetical protein
VNRQGVEARFSIFRNIWGGLDTTRKIWYNREWCCRVGKGIGEVRLFVLDVFSGMWAGKMGGDGWAEEYYKLVEPDEMVKIG